MRDPTFHVYVGEDDDIIRRVAGTIEFEVPEENREELGGIESGELKIELEFADVNGDQEIEAPANARPISALTESLGGTPGLGGVVEGEGGGELPANPPSPTNAGRPRRGGVPGLREVPRRGAPGGHRGAPALRRAAERAVGAR